MLDVSDGRYKAGFNACFVQLPSDAKLKKKTICIDMIPAYILAVKVAFPDAKKRIEFDNFHISKLLTEVINAIRRDEIYSELTDA